MCRYFAQVGSALCVWPEQTQEQLQQQQQQRLMQPANKVLTVNFGCELGTGPGLGLGLELRLSTACEFQVL